MHYWICNKRTLLRYIKLFCAIIAQAYWVLTMRKFDFGGCVLAFWGGAQTESWTSRLSRWGSARILVGTPCCCKATISGASSVTNLWWSRRHVSTCHEGIIRNICWGRAGGGIRVKQLFDENASLRANVRGYMIVIASCLWVVCTGHIQWASCQPHLTFGTVTLICYCYVSFTPCPPNSGNSTLQCY